MSLYVNQQEYKIVDKKDSIGSFGAGPCTILCLYDDKSKLCAHLDALTQEEVFNIEINKYLRGKDKTEINIVLTSSGFNDNFILRNRIIEYLRNIGLENKEQIVEGTQIVLNNKNEIETEFVPEKKFDLSNLDNTLAKELILKSKQLQAMVTKFAKSRKHLPNLDEFGRQKTKSTNVRYDYTKKQWVRNVYNKQLLRNVPRKNLERNVYNKQPFLNSSKKQWVRNVNNIEPFLNYSKNLPLKIHNIKKFVINDSKNKSKSKSKKNHKRKLSFKPRIPSLRIKTRRFKDMNHRQRTQRKRK